MKTVLLASCLLLAGCAVKPGNSYVIVMDESLSPSIQEDVRTAVANWETILDGSLETMIVSGHCFGPEALTHDMDHVICIQASPLSALESNFGAPNYDVGLTHFEPMTDTSVIYLPMDLDKNFIETYMVEIISHELGHGMGLNHTQPGTLMCWSGNCAAVEIQCSDASQWRVIRGMVDISKSCPNGGSYEYEH